jgi:hypothetical protein
VRQPWRKHSDAFIILGASRRMVQPGWVPSILRPEHADMARPIDGADLFMTSAMDADGTRHAEQAEKSPTWLFSRAGKTSRVNDVEIERKPSRGMVLPPPAEQLYALGHQRRSAKHRPRRSKVVG